MQLRYEVPQDGLQLANAWRIIDENKSTHGVTEYAISQTTLEQVFVAFAADQEEETGMGPEALAAMIMSNPPPNIGSLCYAFFCCGSPQSEYGWKVASDTGESLDVQVKFEHGCWHSLFCTTCCCSGNPGIVSVDGQPVLRVHSDGTTTGQPLQISGSSNPGCGASACCGCSAACGASDGCSCCHKTQNVFTHSGKVFEVIDFSEVPGMELPRPCYLFVDGKEAESGIPRNTYMATLFEKIGKKCLCVCALPFFFLMVVSLAGGSDFLLITLLLLMWVVYICVRCVCFNYCGRASHYREEPELDLSIFSGEDAWGAGEQQTITVVEPAPGMGALTVNSENPQ